MITPFDVLLLFAAILSCRGFSMKVDKALSFCRPRVVGFTLITVVFYEILSIM